MGHSTREQFFLSILRTPPDTVDPQDVIGSAVVLTALLIVGVPLLALVGGVPVLAAVAVAGLAYGAFLLATRTPIEGAFAAVFVLLTFAADLPLPVLGVPRGGNAGVLHPEFMLVDVVALPLAGLFAYWWWTGHTPSRPLFDTRGARVAAVALAGLVVWSFLSALVGNGPSRLAAAYWALFQARYLLVFVVAAVIARRIGIRPAVYSLLVAVAGHVLVAIAQTINSGGFGLTQLGDYMRGATNAFALAGVTIPTGMYAGGFAGTVRVLAALAILCIPVLVVLVMDGSAVRRALAALALAGVVFVLRVANTDAGVGAFVVGLALLAVALAVLAVRGTTHTRTDYALGGLALLGSLALTYILYQAHDAGPTATTSGKAPSTTAKAISALPLVSGSYLTVRFNQYTAALDIAARHPLFGIGGLNFTLISARYDLPHAIVVHSAYFGYLAAVGVVGLALFLASLLAVVVVALRNALSRAPPTDRPLWAALVCGGIGFAAFVFWTGLHSGTVAFLVLFVLAGAVVGAPVEEHHPDHP
jgi:hypothetical protein